MKKKEITLILVLFLSFCFFGCSKKRVLEGYVIDAFQKKPLTEKKVWIDQKEYLTDQQGRFETDGILPESVSIKIDGDERFEAFSDQIILHQQHNLRKFEIRARHPLDLPHEKSYLPYSYSLLLKSGKDNSYNDVSLAISGIPADQSFETKGVYLDQQTKQPVTQHLLQLGFNFWYKDEYQNWQYSSMPPIDIPIWGMMIDSYVSAMYEFYYNLDYSYQVDPEEQVIRGEKVRKIIIKPLNDTNLFKEMTIFMVTEGINQGAVWEALLVLEEHAWLGSRVQISFLEVNTSIILNPPEITH